MALTDLVLSTLTFPQNWDGAKLRFNLLLLPAGDPTAKLTAAGIPFAGSSYALEAVLIPGLDNPPLDGAAGAKPFAIPAAAPASSAALFEKLHTKYSPKSLPQKTLAGVQIRKALPDSYVQASSYAPNENPYTVQGDDFGCSLRAQTPAVAAPPSKDLSWGNIISFALRQPALGRGLGLLYNDITIGLDAADLAAGAWLYVRFAAASNPYAADMAANADLVKYFAAHLPAMTAARSLFAPVLFPVGGADSVPSVYDQANLETQAYDDGFAKIVHCNQPKSADAATEEHPELTPASDAGIQIGWDDEQVAIWMNRQLDAARGAAPTGLPFGVLGYRVDVRKKGDGAWQSLCDAQAKIQFDPSIDGVVAIEPPVEPVPARPLSMTSGDVWLPRYFAQWRGPSLVVADPLPLQLSGGTPPASMLQSLVPAGLLRYGTQYEFRVRLTDLTLGGPGVSGNAVHAAASGTGKCTFQRWIKPRTARTSVVFDAADAGKIAAISAWRPLLGYPECLFAGVDPSAMPALVAAVPAAIAGNGVLGVYDPDVTALRIIVEAKAPANDTTDASRLDGRYRAIYQVDVPFPPLPASPIPHSPPPAADGIVISPVYKDIANIKDMAPPAAGNPVQLSVPSARDVRIRLIPLASSANPDYFGSGDVRLGLESHCDTRNDRGSETNLFDTAEQDFEILKAVFLQPGEDATKRLASALDLEANGLTLSGHPGQRVCFGASGAFRHTLSGDHGQITFATNKDLQDHWIVALMPVLNRDWTWNAFQNASVRISRDGKIVGQLEMRQVVDGLMTAPPLDPATQRDTTRLIFLDAIDPHPDQSSPNPFPAALTAAYVITPQLRTGTTLADAPRSIQIHLPKAAAPSQTPVLASAGIALSPYSPSADYSSTDARRKGLWLEFQEPLRDPADRYFIRVLASAPDPLLVAGHSAGQLAATVDVPEPPLAIDPEMTRVITPNQSSDTAGLEAMQPLIPANGENPRHFLVPLPPGLTADSLELFGFFTCEIRVGHAGSGLANWSTAQTRYGRALRVNGLQHPAPGLKCLVNRQTDGIRVAAPFASPVQNGRARPFGTRPYTSMWALLYAQTVQVDGASHRNILLGARPFEIPQTSPWGMPSTFSRDIYGTALFSQKDNSSPRNASPPRWQGVDTLLAALALPADSALSVLAVEMLPQYSDTANNPVDADLGKVRILRTSPLVAVPPIC